MLLVLSLPSGLSNSKLLDYNLELVFVDNDFQALLAPARLIAANSGVDAAVVVEKILSSDWKIGYNAMTGRYEDLMAAGVIDPSQVLRCAIQNAVSVAGVILIT